MYWQSFEHKDIIKYLYSGDCIWIKYVLFMNDNIQSLKTGNSTHEVFYEVVSNREQRANLAMCNSSAATLKHFCAIAHQLFQSHKQCSLHC